MVRSIIYKKQTVRLTEQEYKHLKIQAQISGLKMEPFIRSLIMDVEIKPRPSIEYTNLLRKISAIGNNFNQLVKIANATRNVTPSQLEDCRRMFSDILKHVKGSL